MDFSFFPSLKHRVLVKVAVTLLNHNDIQELILKSYKIKNWMKPNIPSCVDVAKYLLKEVEDEVLKYVLELSLPDVLKNDLLSFVSALSWQLLKYKEYSLFECSYNRNFTKFHWTPQGTIDRKKSAELYINDECMSIDKRYIVACKECIVDSIFALWRQLTEQDMRNLTSCLNEVMDENTALLIIFWNRYIKGKLYLLNRSIRVFCRGLNISPCFTLNEYMFHRSVEFANTSATRYFFQKLTSDEKKNLLWKTAKMSVEEHNKQLPRCLVNNYDGESFADNAVFLISNMNKEQQKEIFRQNPMGALKCFLIWPRQIFFVELAKSTFDRPIQISSIYTIPEIEYYHVLQLIALSILNNYTDYNYRELLAEFWHGSHSTYKEYVTDVYARHPFLSDIFEIEDRENAQLVFKGSFTNRKYKF